ncbi:CAP domain-containing protein [Mucilaginibacter paludis]|nr:CAP domain-containing protein [Mucilaginibacter paludis]
MKRLYISSVLFLLLMPFASGQSSLRISEQQFKEQFLNSINARRAQGCKCGDSFMKAAAPLTWNTLLANAAREHAYDMYRNKYFNHKSKDGRSIEDRLVQAGYTYENYESYAIGENIAYNQQSIEEVLNGWFKSKEHCKNLMDPRFTEIGIAEHQKYWVQDFGGRVKFDSN